MQLSEFLTMLRSEITRIGTAKKAAAEWGVSAQYLSDLLKGRREPGPKILDEFGLYRHVSYEQKDMSGVGVVKEQDFADSPIRVSTRKLS